MSERRTIGVIEMIAEWLLDHGFDGLANGEVECGCSVTDLAPCSDGPTPECMAARAVVDTSGEFDVLFYEAELIGTKRTPDSPTDHDRMQWIEDQAKPGLAWVARQSTRGRGFRLHQSRTLGDWSTAREAIDDAMSRQKEGRDG